MRVLVALEGHLRFVRGKWPRRDVIGSAVADRRTRLAAGHGQETDPRPRRRALCLGYRRVKLTSRGTAYHRINLVSLIHTLFSMLAMTGYKGPFEDGIIGVCVSRGINLTLCALQRCTIFRRHDTS